MRMTDPMNRRIAFLIGASGVGKTAVASVLKERGPWKGNTFHSDTIGVPSPEELDQWPGGGEEWQKWATEQWVMKLAERDTPLQLLEMQTRPSFILPAVEAYPQFTHTIVLLECSPEVRRFRLTELRRRPELLDPRMENWAVYLRGQADALGLRVIQTDDLAPDEVAAAVESAVLDPGSHPVP